MKVTWMLWEIINHDNLTMKKSIHPRYPGVYKISTKIIRDGKEIQLPEKYVSSESFYM